MIIKRSDFPAEISLFFQSLGVYATDCIFQFFYSL